MDTSTHRYFYTRTLHICCDTSTHGHVIYVATLIYTGIYTCRHFYTRTNFHIYRYKLEKLKGWEPSCRLKEIPACKNTDKSKCDKKFLKRILFQVFHTVSCFTTCKKTDKTFVRARVQSGKHVKLELEYSRGNMSSFSVLNEQLKIILLFNSAVAVYTSRTHSVQLDLHHCTHISIPAVFVRFLLLYL